MVKVNRTLLPLRPMPLWKVKILPKLQRTTSVNMNNQ